ncbi:DUF4870 family protein [Noviherbaspirillum autotrophicum]|uniref:Membrane protein n=1 Tax=Noviherbaspirillum autotrophicum TaxID=709839 RepID=A0A0C2BX67_9BURK|nr:membrane protein [Noviherbaspirillum autotrophicum]KIF82616.1 membrane protein [Noviherbaspirillum autotrophicum]
MTQELVFDEKLQSAKNLAWWLYIGHGASFLFSLGAFSWIPLIINYIKRDEALGTFVYTHHSWQIRSFWWFFFWMVISVALAFTIIGIPLAWLIGTVAWVWKAYRLLKGILDLNDNKAMPV